MRNQHGLGSLGVRVGRHRCIARFLSSRKECIEPISEQTLNLVDRRTHIKAQIGRDLFIAASAAVEFVTGVANQRDQLFFNEMVNILRLVIREKRRDRLRLLSNFNQAALDVRRAPLTTEFRPARAHARALGSPPVRRGAGNDRTETIAATARIPDQAAAESGRTTSSLRHLLPELRARPRRQAENPNESGCILLVVTIVHGERREVGPVERKLRFPADDRACFLCTATS